jgi:hypothetical protein
MDILRDVIQKIFALDMDDLFIEVIFLRNKCDVIVGRSPVYCPIISVAGG